MILCVFVSSMIIIYNQWQSFKVKYLSKSKKITYSNTSVGIENFFKKVLLKFKFYCLIIQIIRSILNTFFCYFILFNRILLSFKC